MQGLIDINGAVILPFEFATLFPPTCGVLCCQRDREGKYGYIDLSGTEVIPFQYDYATPFDSESNTALVFRRQGGVEHCFLIRVDGSPVNASPYRHLYHAREGMICCQLNESYGYLDEYGASIILPRYEAATSFSSGLAAVRYEKDIGRLWHIDRSGFRRLGPYEGGVTNMTEFSSGLAWIGLVAHPATRYINTLGDTVIQLSAMEIGEPFSCGLAAVRNRAAGTFYFIDVNGRQVIDLKHGSSASFFQGFAQARENDEEFFIDLSGNRLPCPPGFKKSTVYPACGRMWVRNVKGRYNLADLAGNLVTNESYKNVNIICNGYTTAEKISNHFSTTIIYSIPSYC